MSSKQTDERIRELLRDPGPLGSAVSVLRAIVATDQRVELLPEEAEALLDTLATVAPQTPASERCAECPHPPHSGPCYRIIGRVRAQRDRHRMKMTPEWCERLATLESDSEVGAGMRPLPCICVPEATCPVHGVGAYLDGADVGSPSPLNGAEGPRPTESEPASEQTTPQRACGQCGVPISDPKHDKGWDGMCPDITFDGSPEEPIHPNRKVAETPASERARKTFRTKDRSCENCGRSLSEHEEQRYCPQTAEGPRVMLEQAWWMFDEEMEQIESLVYRLSGPRHIKQEIIAAFRRAQPKGPRVTLEQVEKALYEVAAVHLVERSIARSMAASIKARLLRP